MIPVYRHILPMLCIIRRIVGDHQIRPVSFCIIPDLYIISLRRIKDVLFCERILPGRIMHGKSFRVLHASQTARVKVSQSEGTGEQTGKQKQDDHAHVPRRRSCRESHQAHRDHVFIKSPPVPVRPAPSHDVQEHQIDPCHRKDIEQICHRRRAPPQKIDAHLRDPQRQQDPQRDHHDPRRQCPGRDLFHHLRLMLHP